MDDKEIEAMSAALAIFFKDRDPADLAQVILGSVDHDIVMQVFYKLHDILPCIELWSVSGEWLIDELEGEKFIGDTVAFKHFCKEVIGAIPRRDHNMIAEIMEEARSTVLDEMRGAGLIVPIKEAADETI